jgi:hypothetical protein
MPIFKFWKRKRGKSSLFKRYKYNEKKGRIESLKKNEKEAYFKFKYKGYHQEMDTKEKIE